MPYTPDRNYDPYSLDADDIHTPVVYATAEPARPSAAANLTPVVQAYAVPESSLSPSASASASAPAPAFRQQQSQGQGQRQGQVPSYHETMKGEREVPVFMRSNRHQFTYVNQNRMIGISGSLPAPSGDLPVQSGSDSYRSRGTDGCPCGPDSCWAPSRGPLSCVGPYDARTKTYQSAGLSRFAYKGVNACFAIVACNAFFAIFAVNSFFSFGTINSVCSLFCINSLFSIGCMNSAFKICIPGLKPKKACDVNKFLNTSEYAQDDDNNKVASYCIRCPSYNSGQILLGAKLTQSDCGYCPAGYIAVNYDKYATVQASCQACPAGTYKSSSGNTRQLCTTCATGKTSLVGSSVCS